MRESQQRKDISNKKKHELTQEFEMKMKSVCELSAKETGNEEEFQEEWLMLL